MYPLSFFFKVEHVQLVKWLLERSEGNTLNAQDKDGWTALMWTREFRVMTIEYTYNIIHN